MILRNNRQQRQFLQLIGRKIDMNKKILILLAEILQWVCTMVVRNCKVVTGQHNLEHSYIENKNKRQTDEVFSMEELHDKLRCLSKILRKI
jgi:hypothetical protein